MRPNEKVLKKVSVSRWSLLTYMFRVKMLILLMLAVIAIIMALEDDGFLFLAIILLIFYFFLIILHFNYISRKHYVLTNYRVIVKMRLNKDSSYVPLKQISSISTKREGIIGRLFDFGQIYISTTGSRTFNEIKNIKDPHDFSESISQLITLQ